MAEPPAKAPPSGLDDTAIAETHPSDPAASSEPSASAAAAPRTRLVHAGDTLGRYTLDEEIGEGGMATVFRARDPELRREVAIKVLFPHLARRDEVVRRFHREARSAAGLEHRNILRVYDVGGAAQGDPPYIVMELVRGRSLLAEVEQRAPLLPEIVACIGALLADALGAAHAAGIVHRDVKPANVMIAPGGRLLLADFGVARLETEDSLVTKTGAVLGTPAYMSPEQASGDTSTRRSDLYSLGVSLYQMATGSLPYSGSSAKVLAAITTGGHAPAVRRRPSVGAELSRVIDRLMALEPTARPADAETVATELRAIAAAGGLGEPTEELAAYFTDPAGYVAARTPVVVAALVAAGQRALVEGKLPRALGLADRANAMAPADPGVVALVATVTAGGRSSARRRVGALAAGALVLAGGVALGGRAWLTRSSESAATPDAPMDALARLALAPLDAPPADARGGDPSVPPDAAPPADAAPAPISMRDGGAARPHADLVPRPPPIDAAAAVVAPPPDAAAAVVAPPPDAAPADGSILVENDTWCDLFLDDQPAGRLSGKSNTLRASAGHHVVRCAQRDQQREWHQDVEVPPGGVGHAVGALLGLLTVTVAPAAGELRIDGVAHAPGTLVRLPHGSHRVEAAGGAAQYLTIAADCTLVVAVDERGQRSVGCVAGR